MSLVDNVKKIFHYAYNNQENIAKVVRYLVKYGYLDDKIENGLTDIVKAVSILQELGGLKTTGVVDGKFISLLSWPRCSHRDNLTETATGLAKWGKSNLTYYIASYDNELSQTDWYNTIDTAFLNISNVCNLRFTRVKSIGDANLVLGTGRGASSDFDGASGVLAWFELPQSSNFMGQLQGKFDSDETWIPVGKNGRGIYLLNVATHEILHGLGLEHSKIQTALMAPFYSPEVSKPQENDDISRLVARYGKPANVPPPPPPPPSPTGNNYIVRYTNGVLAVDGHRLIKIG